MKKKSIILLFLLVLAGVGCHKDTDPAAQEPVVSDVDVTPRQNGVALAWDVDMSGKFQTCVELSRYDDMSNLLSLSALESEERFVANIDTLTANTKYYYRIVVWNKFKRFEFGTPPDHFTTLDTPPTPGQDTIYYHITVRWQPEEGGTATGGGTYEEGTEIELTATANLGYTFDHWQDGNTANPRTITVTGDATYTATFTAQPQVPTGAIGGKFTINANGDKVYFSKGNLQYIGSAGNGDANNTGAYWKFADNQWDCLGTTTGQNSTSQTVDRDLFGWGTSGYHDSSDPYNVNYQPWSTSTSTVNETYNYYGYGPSTNMPSPSLTGSSAQYDWGVHNTIYSGNTVTTGWRTLTGGSNGEWDYIFNRRSASTVNGTPDARYAKAKVNNVNGVILFPDSYTHPSGVAQPVGINETGSAGWNGNNYSAAEFGLMQDNGAVFLPAAGVRVGTSVYYVGGSGYYWSVSYSNSDFAYSVFFDDSLLDPQSYSYRYLGRSVRLVRSAQ